MRLVTKSRFAEPTEFLRREGVQRVEHYTVVEAEFGHMGLDIKSGSYVVYHYADKSETPPIHLFVATVPTELIKEFVKVFNEMVGIENK